MLTIKNGLVMNIYVTIQLLYSGYKILQLTLQNILCFFPPKRMGVHVFHVFIHSLLIHFTMENYNLINHKYWLNIPFLLRQNCFCWLFVNYLVHIINTSFTFSAILDGFLGSLLGFRESRELPVSEGWSVCSC